MSRRISSKGIPRLKVWREFDADHLLDGHIGTVVCVAACMSAPSEVRTREPFRKQARMCFEILEDMLPPDHRARPLWRVVETLELSELVRGRKSVKGMRGGTSRVCACC